MIRFRSEHLRSKESEVSKFAADNASPATGQAGTDHRETEEEVEEEEEEEEMRRSVNLPLDLWLLGASRSLFFRLCILNSRLGTLQSPRISILSLFSTSQGQRRLSIRPSCRRNIQDQFGNAQRKFSTSHPSRTKT